MSSVIVHVMSKCYVTQHLFWFFWVNFFYVQDETGRYPVGIFIVLPSKKDYPDYYQIITEPIDMKMIESNMNSGKVFHLIYIWIFRIVLLQNHDANVQLLKICLQMDALENYLFSCFCYYLMNFLVFEICEKSSQAWLYNYWENGKN